MISFNVTLYQKEISMRFNESLSTELFERKLTKPIIPASQSHKQCAISCWIEYTTLTKDGIKITHRNSDPWPARSIQRYPKRVASLSVWKERQNHRSTHVENVKEFIQNISNLSSLKNVGTDFNFLHNRSFEIREIPERESFGTSGMIQI